MSLLMKETDMRYKQSIETFLKVKKKIFKRELKLSKRSLKKTQIFLIHM